MTTKLIGALIGFFASGNSILGALIGYFIGTLFFSNSKQKKAFKKNPQIYFIDNLLVLFAYIIKADGRITENEIKYIKTFLEKNFGQDISNKKILQLRDIIKQDNINIQQTCKNINYILSYSQRLELLHFIFQIFSIDADISKQELNSIHTISSYLHISAWDFATIQTIYFNRRQRNYNQEGYYQNSYQTTQKQIDNAYIILQVKKDSTEQDIKKSYRKLVVKYHPDKVASLGEDIQKQANEKFQEINAAYELIKKERNFS